MRVIECGGGYQFAELINVSQQYKDHVVGQKYKIFSRQCWQ